MCKRLSRKAEINILAIGLLLVYIAALTTALVLTYRDHTEGPSLGHYQRAIAKSIHYGEAILNDFDNAAQLALHDTLYTLGKNGGYASSSYSSSQLVGNCPPYLGRALWLFDDRGTLKSCYPDIEKEIKEEFPVSLFRFLQAQDIIVSDFALSVDLREDVIVKGRSIGSPLNIPIRKEDIGNFFLDANPFTLPCGINKNKAYPQRNMYLGKTESEVKENLATVRLGPDDERGINVKVHRLVASSLMRVQEAWKQCEEFESYEFRFAGGQWWRCMNYGGQIQNCDLDPSKRSLHSWGMAVDLNWDTNPDCYGKDNSCTYDLPQCLIDAFKNNDFNWLGEGNRRDYMHFEYQGDCLQNEEITTPAQAEPEEKQEEISYEELVHEEESVGTYTIQPSFTAQEEFPIFVYDELKVFVNQFKNIFNIKEPDKEFERRADEFNAHRTHHEYGMIISKDCDKDELFWDVVQELHDCIVIEDDNCLCSVHIDKNYLDKEILVVDDTVLLFEDDEYTEFHVFADEMLDGFQRNEEIKREPYIIEMKKNGEVSLKTTAGAPKKILDYILNIFGVAERHIDVKDYLHEHEHGFQINYMKSDGEISITKRTEHERFCEVPPPTFRACLQMNQYQKKHHETKLVYSKGAIKSVEEILEKPLQIRFAFQPKDVIPPVIKRIEVFSFPYSIIGLAPFKIVFWAVDNEEDVDHWEVFQSDQAFSNEQDIGENSRSYYFDTEGVLPMPFTSAVDLHPSEVMDAFGKLFRAEHEDEIVYYTFLSFEGFMQDQVYQPFYLGIRGTDSFGNRHATFESMETTIDSDSILNIPELIERMSSTVEVQDPMMVYIDRGSVHDIPESAYELRMANFYVLRNTEVPAVLTESFNMKNDHQVAFFADNDFEQTKDLAQRYAKAIINFSTMRPITTVIIDNGHGYYDPEEGIGDPGAMSDLGDTLYEGVFTKIIQLEMIDYIQEHAPHLTVHMLDTTREQTLSFEDLVMGRLAYYVRKVNEWGDPHNSVYISTHVDSGPKDWAPGPMMYITESPSKAAKGAYLIEDSEGLAHLLLAYSVGEDALA